MRLVVLSKAESVFFAISYNIHNKSELFRSRRSLPAPTAHNSAMIDALMEQKAAMQAKRFMEGDASAGGSASSSDRSP